MVGSGTLGQYALTVAFSRGQASVVATFEYSALIWGLLLDWLIWRAAPASMTLFGATLIMGSGVFLFQREAQASRSQ